MVTFFFVPNRCLRASTLVLMQLLTTEYYGVKCTCHSTEYGILIIFKEIQARFLRYITPPRGFQTCPPQYTPVKSL